MEATTQIDQHISDKITYHQKLMKQLEAVEDYERCAYHRDEVIRLKNMLA